jgi:stearoyl-CoA 9-desaturase NADPH oxidoreductase
VMPLPAEIITPVMAMLRALVEKRPGRAAAEPATEVRFVHVARSRSEAIFVEELETLASRLPWLRLSLCFTSQTGRFDDYAWSQLAREAADAPAFVCGPAAFMEAAHRAWARTGCQSQLHVERFELARVSEAGADGAEVTATRAGQSFTAAPGKSLLEAAEAAGLRPKHGCRMGICHTCVCRKLEGTTVDLRDGRVSSEPGEMIQLCVSAPRTAVTLDL